MMRNTQIQVCFSCEYCSNGVTYNQNWVDWGKRQDASAAHFAIGTAEYYEALNRFCDLDPGPNESEELQCIECEGTTWRYQWLSIEELAASFVSGLKVRRDGSIGGRQL